MKGKLTVSASDLGTSEEAWLASAHLATCPLLSLDKSTTRRIVVVAPHPDDEVLAVGGLLRHLARDTKASLKVIAVTDGEASHPTSTTVTPVELAKRRAEERDRALAYLGLSSAETVRLSISDGRAREASDLTDSNRGGDRGRRSVHRPMGARWASRS